MRQHPRTTISHPIIGSLAAVLVACGPAALVISFITTGQPEFMRALIPLACIIIGLAGVFYVPLYAGRKLPLVLRMLAVIQWEMLSLMLLFSPFSFEFRSSTSSILNEIFNPNLLSALHEFINQAIFPGFLLVCAATLVKWIWEKRVMRRVKEADAAAQPAGPQPSDKAA